MKKNITKLIVLCLIAGTSFSACKKDDNKKPVSNTYSMKFNANGTAVSYTSCLVADIDINGSKLTDIIGVNKNNSNNEMELEFPVAVSSLKAGQTYQVIVPTGNNQLELTTPLLGYTMDGTNYFTTQSADPVGTVTITSVTSTTLQGTFSGKLYSEDDSDATTLKYTITNGTFVGLMPQ
jgi:hypothetical protein